MLDSSRAVEGSREESRVSVVLPTWGGLEALGAVLSQASDFASKERGGVEAIVVDDGEHGEVDALVRTWRKRFARCVLVRHNKRRGIGAAVRTGVLMTQGEFVVVVGPGVDNPFESAAALLPDLRRGADIVIASRRLPGGSEEPGRPSTRKFAELLHTAAARLLVPVGVRDLHSGLVLMARHAAMQVARRAQCEGTSWSVEWIAVAQRLGLQVIEAPARLAWRAGGTLGGTLGLLRLTDLVTLRSSLRGLAYHGPQPRESLLSDTTFVSLDRAAILEAVRARARGR